MLALSAMVAGEAWILKEIISLKVAVARLEAKTEKMSYAQN